MTSIIFALFASFVAACTLFEKEEEVVVEAPKAPDPEPVANHRFRVLGNDPYFFVLTNTAPDLPLRTNALIVEVDIHSPEPSFRTFLKNDLRRWQSEKIVFDTLPMSLSDIVDGQRGQRYFHGDLSRQKQLTLSTETWPIKTKLIVEIKRVLLHVEHAGVEDMSGHFVFGDQNQLWAWPLQDPFVSQQPKRVRLMSGIRATDERQMFEQGTQILRQNVGLMSNGYAISTDEFRVVSSAFGADRSFTFQTLD